MNEARDRLEAMADSVTQWEIRHPHGCWLCHGTGVLPHYDDMCECLEQQHCPVCGSDVTFTDHGFEVHCVECHWTGNRTEGALKGASEAVAARDFLGSSPTDEDCEEYYKWGVCL